MGVLQVDTGLTSGGLTATLIPEERNNFTLSNKQGILQILGKAARHLCMESVQQSSALSVQRPSPSLPTPAQFPPLSTQMLQSIHLRTSAKCLKSTRRYWTTCHDICSSTQPEESRHYPYPAGHGGGALSST